MKELGWKGFAQSLKRLSAAGRQKLLKLKFRWRGFISRLKEAMIDGWTSLMFVSLPLLFVLSEKLSPFYTLFLLVFLLGLALLSVVLHYRFGQISSHALSLKPSESFRWEKSFQPNALRRRKSHSEPFANPSSQTENSPFPSQPRIFAGDLCAW
jgi:hypothetical protein